MQIGICISNIAPNQLTYEITNSLNAAVKARALKDDVVIFYENRGLYFPTPMCSQMGMSETWGFDGILIATSISTAEKIARAPSQHNKYLFAYNLEWLNQQLFAYEPLVGLVGQFRIITRTEEHKKLWLNNFNQEPFGVLERANITQLLETVYAAENRNN